MTTQFIAAPTQPSTLLVLSLLATGGQHHENELKEYARINRPSHCISELRKATWEIQTIAGGKGEGSSYMMTNPDQLDRAQTFDISAALTTMDSPPPEVESIYVATVSSPKVLGQLSLFTEDNNRRDKRFSIEELVLASLAMLKKTQMELLSGDTTVFEQKVQCQISKGAIEVTKAYEMLTKGE